MMLPRIGPMAGNMRSPIEPGERRGCGVAVLVILLIAAVALAVCSPR